MADDDSLKEKIPFLFQIQSGVHGKEITSLFLIYAYRSELTTLLDEYTKTLYGKKTGWDKALGAHIFEDGLVSCRIGRVSATTDATATTLKEKGLVVDITGFNQQKTYDELSREIPEYFKKQDSGGLKMSGRLHVKNFSTCKLCSSSIISGKPSSVDPAWNSAHLYDAMKSEEHSFRNIHSVSMRDKLNISWAVPVVDEIVRGEGRCEFCQSYCEKTRTIVSMVVVL